jgi:hypothetical protein
MVVSQVGGQAIGRLKDSKVSKTHGIATVWFTAKEDHDAREETQC